MVSAAEPLCTHGKEKEKEKKTKKKKKKKKEEEEEEEEEEEQIGVSGCHVGHTTISTHAHTFTCTNFEVLDKAFQE